ncbi:MAG: alpha/beta hydrolase [Gammaproteobacteria bacterium]|nr:alpha/beta hydrolase [Gammaproteobacteria bacterium]
MALRAGKPEKIFLNGEAGRIECVLEEVADPSANKGSVAVVCHPHPLFGGTMDNKVVHTLSRAFHRLGVSTLRFNFRGVGDSDGEHDEGRGETDDAVAVADWAMQRFGGSVTQEATAKRLWLAGFSFGAWIAVRAAARRRCAQLVTIAPPVQRFAIRDEAQPDCPWLIVQGSADELVDSDAVLEWVNELGPGPEFVLLPDVDHFFHGALTDLRDTLLANLGSGDPLATNT